MMKNFRVTPKASSVERYRLYSRKTGKMSPKKIMKKGKEHPVAKAQIVPTIRWSLSLPSAYLNRDITGAILAF